MSISGLWLKKAKSAIARGINTSDIPIRERIVQNNYPQSLF
ncbi:hypothetical protein [Microcoleus sp. CAWBG58]|nr:hypothetical protein [Microcoleus sp. CAWBG58]